MDGENRRGFLGKLTLLIGGVIGAALSVPVIRYLVYPVKRKIVSSSGEPVVVAQLAALGPEPTRVEITARRQVDAWAAVENVPLGAAWLRKSDDGSVQAFTTVCPHLGCAIDYDAEQKEFRCPCHTSAFAPDGSYKKGPARRGMDPLPVTIKDGKVLVEYIRYVPDIAERKKA